MTRNRTVECQSSGGRASSRWFWLLSGTGLVAISIFLTVLSLGFRHGEGRSERPIVLVCSILFLGGAIYFVAALRALRDPPSLRAVLAFALLCRVVLLFSAPIQEDDVYRYLWDGKVVAEGIDPFLFSPREILDHEAAEGGAGTRSAPELAELAALRDRSRHNRAILERVNHRDLVTVYPALVQQVFGVAGACVSEEWSVPAQVRAMKAFLALFDVGVILVLAVLLRILALPPGRAVLYAWCPLVLKELSNSGHMDAVPALFLVSALLLAVVAKRTPRSPRGATLAVLAGLTLGAAIGAKLFAVILLPLLARWLGILKGGLAMAACAGGVAWILCAYPEGAERRSETLVEFLLGWDHNAAFFIWLEKACQLLLGSREWRLSIGGAEWLVVASPFVARLTCAVLVGTVALSVAWRTHPGAPELSFLARAFSILACLFLFGPLGFPWYFVWCAALLPFARGRAWFLLPGLLTVYYLRFHYRYNHDSMGYATEEEALDFFDHVIVTAEFCAFYAAYIWERWRGAGERRSI